MNITMDYFIGKTIEHIKKIIACTVHEEDRLIFKLKTGETIVMEHEQECCEDVSIKDINGDLDDIINSPILSSEEYSKDYECCEYNILESCCECYGYNKLLWTFYKLSTIKGSVKIRWLGESNGYGSEKVYLKLIY